MQLEEDRHHQAPNITNEFKRSEKHYKFYNKKKTDFSEIIDVNTKTLPKGVSEFSIKDPLSEKTFKCFKFESPSGLILIKDYINKKRQVEICQKSLNIYHKKPHRTNLYIYEDDFKNDPKWKDTKFYNKEHFIVDDPKRYHFNTKIRWSNIGKQYDWDNRGYLKTQSKVPKELEEMALEIINLLKMGDYNPEALIVNFYNWKNFMGGHLDDGEPDQEHPIISFSFGLSCVFLIGGKTKEEKPHAIKLDTGDVLIMSKEARVCYHGVPRVLKGSFDMKEYIKLFNEEELDAEWPGEVIEDGDGLKMNTVRNTLVYMSESRINMNFRQVIPGGPGSDSEGEDGEAMTEEEVE